MNFKHIFKTISIYIFDLVLLKEQQKYDFSKKYKEDLGVSAVFLSVFTEHDVLSQVFLSSTVKHPFHNIFSPFCVAEALLGSVWFLSNAGMFL